MMAVLPETLNGVDILLRKTGYDRLDIELFELSRQSVRFSENVYEVT